MVGVSGGMDSAVLAHILSDWRDRGGPELVAAHIHHGVRGEEADRDAAVAEKLAHQHDLPFHVAHLSFLPSQEVSESLLREKRLGTLEHLAKEVGASYIALAHQRDDQAETVLFRMLGGADLKGLGGISIFRPPLWLHPMLTTSRKEIEEEVQTCDLPYIKDSSNVENYYRRNFLRNQLIPLLEKEFNPRLAEHLCALGESASRAVEFMEEEADHWRASATLAENTYSAVILRKAPVVVRYQVLQNAFKKIANQHGALHRKSLAALDHLIMTGGVLRVLELPSSVVAVRRDEVLALSLKERI